MPKMSGRSRVRKTEAEQNCLARKVLAQGPLAAILFLSWAASQLSCNTAEVFHRHAVLRSVLYHS